MKLHMVTKQAFDARTTTDWCLPLGLSPATTHLIPMGGDNELGRAGIQLIADMCPATYTHIVVSVGSGTTLAGLRLHLPGQQQVIGFAPMKQGDYLKDNLAPLLEDHPNWQIITDYHFGGFGKITDDLVSFMRDLYHAENLPTDRVYTAKMMFGICDMIHNNRFSPTDRLLCIHTGGLQGNASISHRLGY
jgi:1-aminocyclopropane-1-carboxylate deaminase